MIETFRCDFSDFVVVEAPLEEDGYGLNTTPVRGSGDPKFVPFGFQQADCYVVSTSSVPRCFDDAGNPAMCASDATFSEALLVIGVFLFFVSFPVMMMLYRELGARRKSY